eukprot:CAMPEP_0180270822 /NCGR_PEP_ID=MMETSP0988-20121125/3390_1 /TAXON_ID=697907 /ORGANISM="non described non described, Strain CCMP2293" /LENGTH=352 /DNA_ID=CAMNT_0022241799 /DNA_START=81 /DNA_END=1136 /DNA_ORIENTATION=-
MAPPKAMPAEPEDNRGMSRWEEAVSPGGPSQWDVPSQFGSPIQNSDDMSMGGVSAIAAKPSRRGERSSQRAGDAHFHASKPRRGAERRTSPMLRMGSMAGTMGALDDFPLPSGALPLPSSHLEPPSAFDPAQGNAQSPGRKSPSSKPLDGVAALRAEMRDQGRHEDSIEYQVGRATSDLSALSAFSAMSMEVHVRPRVEDRFRGGEEHASRRPDTVSRLTLPPGPGEIPRTRTLPRKSFSGSLTTLDAAPDRGASPDRPQPYIPPEMKLKLTKNGLRAHHVSLEPDPWDGKEVEEMLGKGFASREAERGWKYNKWVQTNLGPSFTRKLQSADAHRRRQTQSEDLRLLTIAAG